MLVNPDVLEDLYNNAGLDRRKKAMEYVYDKRVHITKVTYDNSENLEIRSIVTGHGDRYQVYIKVADNEVDDVRCECPDYQKRYGACKHIVATMMEFMNNHEYAHLFQGENFEVADKFEKKAFKDIEKYRTFKQLINSFYHQEMMTKDDRQTPVIIPHSVRIEPKLIYDSFHKDLKIEFKIGDKQLYKLKNLPECYERMLRNMEQREKVIEKIINKGDKK